MSEELNDREAVLYKAVKHILNLRQKDPDIGWYICPHSGSFEFLCEAEAAVRNEPPEDVRARREKDLQPEHFKRDADVVVMKSKLRQIEALAERPNYDQPRDVETFAKEIRQILQQEDWSNK